MNIIVSARLLLSNRELTKFCSVRVSHGNKRGISVSHRHFAREPWPFVYPNEEIAVTQMFREIVRFVSRNLSVGMETRTYVQLARERYKISRCVVRGRYVTRNILITIMFAV